MRAWLSEDNRYDNRAILADALTLLRTTDFDSVAEREFIEIGDEYPALQSIRARYWYAKVAEAWLPNIQADANSFNPESIASQAVTILEQKRKLPRRCRGQASLVDL